MKFVSSRPIGATLFLRYWKVSQIGDIWGVILGSIGNITIRSQVRVFCYCGCIRIKPLNFVRYWLEYREVWGSNKEGSTIVRVTELWQSQINLRNSHSRRIISYSPGNLSIVIFSLTKRVGSTCGDVIHMDLIDRVVECEYTRHSLPIPFKLILMYYILCQWKDISSMQNFECLRDR